MRFFTAITFGVLLLSPALATATSSTPATSKTPRSYKVLAFGDSLTAGFQLPLAQAYPAQLESKLKGRGFDVQVVNAGVSGDTSAQGLRRVAWSLKQESYDYVLLCLGGNDGLRNLPVKDFEANMRSIVEAFKKSGATVVLLGIRLPLNIDEKYRKDFEATYVRLARDQKLTLLPFVLEGVATNHLLNLEDQMHPNKEGQVIVADNILKVLEPLLKKSAAKP